MSAVNVTQYYARLKLDPSKLDTTATLAKLCALQEAHIREIPFENTALHGVHGGPPSLNVTQTAEKILVQKRGGFCYEVNLLFAVFLRQLGYQVTCTPAYVYKVHLNDFLPLAMHIILIVTTEDGCRVLADVGFGESWLHPLRYEDKYMNIKQKTPEGMCIKIIRDEDNVVLMWRRGENWIQRLKWSYKESIAVPGAMIDDFKLGYNAVLSSQSPFVKGLIVCKLTRLTKTTLAGNKLKITTNRFQPNETVTVQSLSSVEEARKVLEDQFGIPFEKTAGLDINIKGEDTVWSTI